MTRRLWLSALLTLWATSRVFGAALAVPEGGLPAGRLALTPIISARASVPGTWGVLQDFLRTGGASLPNAAEIASLDPAAGRYAAGALVGPVPVSLWADMLNKKDLDPVERARMLSALAPVMAQAGQRAAEKNGDVVARLQAEIDAGRVGAADLQDAADALRGLSVYNPAFRAVHAEVAQVLEKEKSRSLSAKIEQGAASWHDGKTAEPAAVAGAEAEHPSQLSKPKNRSHVVGRALTISGVTFLTASAVAAIHPAWAPALVPLQGVLTWAGAALSTAGRFFAQPRGPPAAQAAAAADSSRLGKLGQKILNRVPTFRELWSSATASADAQKNLEAKVGDSSWGGFVKWISGAARTALYWFPLALGGMLAGNVLSKIPSLFVRAAHAAATAVPSVAHAAKAAPAALSHAQSAAIAKFSLLSFLNGYVAQAVLLQVAMTGVGFRVLRWAGTKILGSEKRWALAAGVLTLAGYAAFLIFTGMPGAAAAALVGTQAVILYAYQRSGSLWAAAGISALFALMGAESARMIAWLDVTENGALATMPHWADWAVGGMTAAAAAIGAWKIGFKAFWKKQTDALKSLGETWSKPTADGAPKSPWALFRTGLLWALPTFFSMAAAFAAVHHFLPQTEPTPEILKRMILMPLDIIVYNFIIVAALEEWVFRRGVFKPIVEKLKKWVSPKKSWFWPAAILSSLIFSGAHYIDWGAALAHIGIGSSDVASSMAGAYAFTWASFAARAVGGMVLAWLYAQSGLIIVPMIAHFGSNLLESIGMKWGLAPFLASVAAVLALQLLKRKEPAPKA